ncbi:sensor histidine kinase [Dictyobacter arantiisoli]|uniref:Sensor histidine kinase YxjM n=1 Tax=Dictyobacter arantiisoli TaxID=2014874 RepID=A0A5A5TJ13_9CHLR|nr:sensor histidine kinase [Dictyobacter arantiisoli]GCF10934.1 sensor histidine kinase YxjM [Dictyobacter arantiisoli]
MSAHFDIEKDNISFFRIFKRVLIGMVILICTFFAGLTYSILNANPSYMHDWRGFVYIVLVIVAFLLYACPTLFAFSWRDWPPPLGYAVSIWSGLYLVVFLLTLINNTFQWAFYVVFSISLSLFSGRRQIIAVAIMALTLFAFQGLLIWPLSGDAIVSIVSQVMPIFSMTGFIILFQRLVKERFERNTLFQKLDQANSELAETHRQLEQSMVQNQELAVLRERTRLAREMHDTIGHALVLISVKLEAAQRLRERDPGRCERELESTKEIAREAMTVLRASIANLRSPVLERESINHALSRSARELAHRTGLHVTYTLQADIECLPVPVEEALWKVSQEAFTNIEKHAHASHVQACISWQDEKLLMLIHDDGVGLPQHLYQSQQENCLTYSSPEGHYGLRGMFERIEAIGGQFTLRSGREQGTTIEIELPLAHVDKRASAQTEVEIDRHQ